jgi:lysophospholipase L1-like esterase
VVLCFGDSNTYGAPSEDDGRVRLPPDVRWTGRLQRLLGDGYSVVEEGLNGRTTNVDYDDRPGCNGLPYFVPCLLSHQPIEVVVLTLGTNDLKTQFDRSLEAIAESLGSYVDALGANATSRSGATPRLVLVSPVPLDDGRPGFAEMEGEFDALSVAKSRELSAHIRRTAERRGALFGDSAAIAETGADGVHLDIDSHARLADLLAAKVRAALADAS